MGDKSKDIITNTQKVIGGALPRFTASTRKKFVKYAFNSGTLQQMSDDTFLDFVVFASKQVNVDDLEGLRKTLNAHEVFSKDKTKNPKKFHDKAKLYMLFLVSLLVTGILLFLVVSVLYALWYRNTDTVKSTIGFSLFLLICGVLLLFCTFLLLYNVVVIQYKKIMLLL
jgi:uncharacterized BrkB/YihY/UPF0761 family membrane protein